MPAPRMMKSGEIAGYLGVTSRTGRNVMQQLEAMGRTVVTQNRITAAEKAIANGKRPGSPVKLVDYRVFAKWITDQDGRDVEEVAKDVRQWLTESRREESANVSYRR